MSLRGAALPRLQPARARLRRTARDVLVFSEPGAPLVAICGLHGGAGTTTLACLLAEQAAAASPAGRVLAIEGDPRAGELSRRLGIASALTLSQLALARGSESTAAVVQRADGLRVLAGADPDLATAPPGALAAVLADARSLHALCVVDAGTLRQPAAEVALAGADIAVWVAHPDRLEATTLASPLARPAGGARWVLVLVGGERRRVPRALRTDLAAVVALRRSAMPDGPGRRAAAERLARAVRG